MASGVVHPVSCIKFVERSDCIYYLVPTESGSLTQSYLVPGYLPDIGELPI